MFRKRYTPEQFGAMLYEVLREGMAAEGPLSLRRLQDMLGVPQAHLRDQYVGEVMIGGMFGAVLAIERSTPPWLCRRIRSGLEREFFKHLFEQGAAEREAEEWQVVLFEHFVLYFKTMPPGETEVSRELGRRFFLHIAGMEPPDEDTLTACRHFLNAARDTAQHLVDEHEADLLL